MFQLILILLLLLKVTLYGHTVTALIDSGSSESFIHPTLVSYLNSKCIPSNLRVSMAFTNLSTGVNKCCSVNLEINGRKYENQKLSLLTVVH